MASIVLPSYQTRVANEIFTREAAPVHFPNGEELPATEIFRLTKCTFPSLDDAVSYIQAEAGALLAAEDAKASAPAHAREPEQEASLTREVLQQYFVPENWAAIARGEEAALKDIQAHYDVGILQPGKSYLYLLGIQAPNDGLDIVVEQLKQWSGAFEQSLRAAGIPYWNLSVRLQEDDSLPSAAELAYLAEREVRDSNVFIIRGRYDYTAVSEELRCVVQALPTAKDVAAVRDVSRAVIDQRAATALQRLVVSWHMEALGDRLSTIFANPPEEDSVLDRFEPSGVPPKDRN